MPKKLAVAATSSRRSLFRVSAAQTTSTKSTLALTISVPPRRASYVFACERCESATPGMSRNTIAAIAFSRGEQECHLLAIPGSEATTHAMTRDS
jgi:hypothetical protein